MADHNRLRRLGRLQTPTDSTDLLADLMEQQDLNELAAAIQQKVLADDDFARLYFPTEDLEEVRSKVREAIATGVKATFINLGEPR